MKSSIAMRRSMWALILTVMLAPASSEATEPPFYERAIVRVGPNGTWFIEPEGLVPGRPIFMSVSGSVNLRATTDIGGAYGMYSRFSPSFAGTNWQGVVAVNTATYGTPPFDGPGLFRRNPQMRGIPGLASPRSFEQDLAWYAARSGGDLRAGFGYSQGANPMSRFARSLSIPGYFGAPAINRMESPPAGWVVVHNRDFARLGALWNYQRGTAGAIGYSEAGGAWMPHDAFRSQDIAIEHLTTGAVSQHGARIKEPLRFRLRALWIPGVSDVVLGNQQASDWVGQHVGPYIPAPVATVLGVIDMITYPVMGAFDTDFENGVYTPYNRWLGDKWKEHARQHRENHRPLQPCERKNDGLDSMRDANIGIYGRETRPGMWVR